MDNIAIISSIEKIVVILLSKYVSGKKISRRDYHDVKKPLSN